MPGLRTLDKYILGKFLRTYIFGILMMIIILVVFDYVEKVDDFTELKAPMKEIIWDYYMNFIPQFVSQFSALFTFIAVIFFTSKMAMQTEIVAILSGGVSFRRFMWPYIVGATLITAMSLVLSLWIIPEGQKASVEFQSKYLKSQQLVEYDDHVYRQIEDGTYAYVRGFSPGMERTILATRVYHIAGCCPTLRLHIECGICSIERLDKLCALEALNGEEGDTLHAWREAAHIGICAVLNLAIYMVVIFHQLLAFEILALELYARLLALGDNPQAKHKAHRRN